MYDIPGFPRVPSMARTVRYFPESGDYLTFVEEFLLRNQPCVFAEIHTRDWRARQRWQTAGKPNLETLSRDFGTRPHRAARHGRRPVYRCDAMSLFPNRSAV